MEQIGGGNFPMADSLLDKLKAELLRTNPYNPNVASSGNLNGNNLDLNAIAAQVPTFHGYVTPEIVGLRFPEFAGTVAFISASGKVVCGGAKTENEATLTAQMVASEFSRVLGYPFVYQNDIKVEVEVVPNEVTAATEEFKEHLEM